MSKTLLSGMQPTNGLHLGNYLGALRNWVELQSQFDCYFLAVDAHSITTPIDPKELRENTYYVIAAYIAGGVDPKKCTLFVQSHVPEHFELAWILTCATYMGELNRMTQFKDKSSMAGQNIPTGLFTYPVLMAADILLYQTQLVPVGEDQKQHLELTRDLAERMNNRNKKTGAKKNLFVVPDPHIAKTGRRIMDLQDPTKKMSKSAENPKGCVFLTDSDKEIEKKFKTAVTDSGSTIRHSEDQPGIRNLIEIQSALTGFSTESIEKTYEGKQYGVFKAETAEIVKEKLGPMREKCLELLKNRDYLDQILREGALKARERASQTLREVKSSLGFTAPLA